MPMRTQIIRDEKPIAIRWGRWHLNRLVEAMFNENPKVDLWAGFPRDGKFVFQKDHLYFDPSDGEIFIVKAGDIYEAWR